MTIETIIQSGTVVTADSVRETDIAIDNGQIVAVGDATNFSEAERTIDATGYLVMPGVVDPHVHIDDMFSGDTYETATRAAALGGVTTLIDFGWQAWSGETSPYETKSSLLEGIERKQNKAGEALVDYGLHGGITREDPTLLDKLETAIDAGVTSFKMYTTYEMGVSYGFIERVFEQLAELGGVSVVHTEDPAICDTRTAKLQKNGRGDPTDYPGSRPDYAEAISAGSAARLAAEHGAKYYGFHTTSQSAMEELAQIRSQAGPEVIRAETCTHYTTLDESVYADLENLAMIAPP
jgi:dihydropyrimidinase